jgi:hypothetical protein
MEQASMKTHQPSTIGRQRGVVLFIALIVMVAMSLAAIALIRSVDTTNILIGNLAFRQSSILPANMAVEQAAAALFPEAACQRSPIRPRTCQQRTILRRGRTATTRVAFRRCCRPEPTPRR